MWFARFAGTYQLYIAPEGDAFDCLNKIGAPQVTVLECAECSPVYRFYTNQIDGATSLPLVGLLFHRVDSSGGAPVDLFVYCYEGSPFVEAPPTTVCLLLMDSILLPGGNPQRSAKDKKRALTGVVMGISNAFAGPFQLFTIAVGTE